MRIALIKSGVVENVCVAGDERWRAQVLADGYEILDLADEDHIGPGWIRNAKDFKPEGWTDEVPPGMLRRMWRFTERMLGL